MTNRNTTIPLATATPGARDVNVVFLAANYVPDISSSLGQVITVHIGIGVTNDAIIEYTVDGTIYHSFLNSEILKKNSALEKQITIRQGDEVNFRAKSAILLDYCRVDLV